MLTSQEWPHADVPQAEFTKLHASEFGEVTLVFEKG
jgi:hypothetical protein